LSAAAAVAPAAAASTAVTITPRFILSADDRARSIRGDAGRRCALHNNNNNNNNNTYNRIFFVHIQYSSNMIYFYILHYI
jgi:hypothetical protein